MSGKHRAHARFLVGDRLLVAGHYERAILELTKAIFLDHSQGSYFLSRGTAYMHLGDLKSCISNLRRAEVLSPGPAPALTSQLANVLDLQAQLFLDLCQYDTARLYVQQAIEKDSLQAGFWLHSALANVGLGDLEAAVSDLDRCLVVDASNVDVWVLRGKLQWKLGEKALGDADLRSAQVGCCRGAVCACGVCACLRRVPRPIDGWRLSRVFCSLLPGFSASIPNMPKCTPSNTCSGSNRTTCTGGRQIAFSVGTLFRQFDC